MFSSENDITFLINIFDIKIPLLLLNVSYIASRMSVGYDKGTHDIRAFCAKYIPHRLTERYKSLYIKMSCSKSL